jgi:RND family efflux transporter MFP subunit
VYVKSAYWGCLGVTQHYLGTIEPEVEAVLSAQTTGYITELYKDVGDRISKGEAAAKIDMRISEARKNALVTELSGAQEDLTIKKIIRNRRRELILSQAVSRESLDESELAVSLAESRVRRLEQELAAATVSLSFSRLESFFDGIITERMKEIGYLVMSGTPVLRVEDQRQGYKILVQVPQKTAAVLASDTPLE